MQWGLGRALVVAVATALPMALSMAPADSRAQDVCSNLQSQLANLPFATDRGQRALSYASAIARQNIELRQARADLRRLGCSNGSVTVFGGQNAGACAAITSTIDQMERNLRQLVQQRDETAFGGDPAERGRILAALSENDCNDASAVEASAETEGTMEGGDLPETDDALSDMPTTFGNMGAAAQDGPLRTVCVRTCDGGFFPISSAATPSTSAGTSAPVR